MKVLYLAIFGIILLLVFIVNGCSYPTSYKAFIPKALDSDYKEYQRLCKEEIGKVIYARPVPEGMDLENMFLISGNPTLNSEQFLNKAIAIIPAGISDKNFKPIYIYIQGFRYYNSWVTPSLSMHNDVKQYVECTPLLYGKNWKEEYTIIKKMAFENKEYIGKEYEEVFIDWKKHNAKGVYRKVTHFKQNNK